MSEEFTGNLLDQDEQQMTIELKLVEARDTFHLSVIYAKYFNVITSMDEKIRGIPYQMKKSIDFISMIEDCGLIDLGFHGPRYIWSNGRGPGSIVWKRLDKGPANDHWLTSFPATTFTHLASADSDHSPLLMEMHVRQDNAKKYFSALSRWSRQQYGDIFLKPKEYEQNIKLAKEKWATTNDPTYRITLHELQAQYISHLKLEKEVLKQKTQLQWFKEGDANSRSRDPDMKELKQVVFFMNPTSVAGADGMNGNFFQSCWEVIKTDLLKVVLVFFGGTNQSGFVKGRSISENIMLAQEIVQGIKKPNFGANVVIKLDIEKSYDRVS
ncbi:uncharacterized protein [Nicotiana tomentosiformis]|uniref:uncharacterized protein n=1 Tax=Nicotiana tomentosiformis TaxID=4098 RepID=UPI00388CD2EA